MSSIESPKCPKCDGKLSQTDTICSYCNAVKKRHRAIICIAIPIILLSVVLIGLSGFSIPITLLILSVVLAYCGTFVLAWTDKKKTENIEEMNTCPIVIDPDKLEEARAVLLKHYTDEQTAQGTRLIGFVAGLFALYQLTLNSISSESLGNIVITMFSSSTNFITIFLLVAGTTVILVFIMRTMLRYAVFGHMVTILIQIDQGEIRKLLSYEFKNKWKEYKLRPLLAYLHLSVSRCIYLDKIVFFIFPARYFLSVDKEPKIQVYFPDRTKRGYVGLFALSMSFSILLVLVLWR